MTTEAIGKGTLIDGRYDIREQLGQGGMGTVYRALDRKLNQMVALKILRNGDSGSARSREERRRRFMHEIYAINEVDHRNVVHIQEFGFFQDTPYMVMELLRGKDLSRLLKESAGALPIDYCVDVLLVVIAAIHACHQKGIVHRDLKPGNIMIIEADHGPGWDVKVVDFSISKAAAELTRDGQILGTPSYLSPEQVNGRVSPASDQYALGVLLYVCLTKRHPFEGRHDLPLIRAIERGDFPSPRSHRPDIPEELENIILTAMHVDPERRYPSVYDFGRQLWPFGSQLGRGVWKKYYFETPRLARPQSDAHRSTTGIPLLLRMAEGKAPFTAPTALANYDSATIARTTTTVDDPAARAHALADVGAATMSIGETSIESVSEVPAEAQAAVSPVSRGGPSSARSRHRRPVAAVIVALTIGIVGGTVALLAPRHSARPSTGGLTVPGANRSPAARAPQPAVTPPARPVPPLASTPAKDAEDIADRGTPAASDNARRAKRPIRDRARRKDGKAAEWGTDPFGNPIPPP